MEGNDSSGGNAPDSTGEQSTLSESANGDGEPDTLQPDQIEQANPAQQQPSKEVGELATYSTSQNGVSYRLIPQITNTGSRWSLWIFISGVQGPVLKTQTGVSDAQADDLGLSRQLQDQLNTALEQANEELEIPAGFRGQSTNKRSLNDLEEVLGN